MTLMAHNRTPCIICHADLCVDCIGHEEWDPGDYHTVYCKDCWALGAGYREKIAMLNKDIELTEDAWSATGERVRMMKMLSKKGDIK